MSNATTAETLALIKAAQQNPQAELAKSWTQQSATSGITAYDLEAGAKLLYPVITPLRNKIPRVSGKGGTQANWRAITGIDTTAIGWGVSEGNRAPVMSSTTTDYTAAYKAFGLDDNVSYEADLAAQGFDDLKSVAVMGLLRATMIQEEKLILGGNSSIALGTPSTPTVATATTGGTLAALTYSIICVALTLEGYNRGSVSGGLPLSATRTLADGTTEAHNDGTSIKSTAATQITTGTTSTVSATVTAINGAVAYAWFWGVGGSELLGAITTINSVLIAAAATGTQNASAGFTADKSQNSMVFDGLLTQIMKSGSGSYVKVMASGTAGTGTPLTGAADGSISEIDAALRSFWDNYRLSPTIMYVNSQELANFRTKALTGSTTSAQRFVFDTNQQGVMIGSAVKGYTNPYTMDGAKMIDIQLHPNIPPGTILLYSDSINYPLSNVVNLVQMKMRRDYYQIEWPIRTRKYEYGVYADGVLQNYFPPAFGVIRNIGNG